MRQIRYRRRYNCGAQLHYGVLSHILYFKKKCCTLFFNALRSKSPVSAQSGGPERCLSFLQTKTVNGQALENQHVYT